MKKMIEKSSLMLIVLIFTITAMNTTATAASSSSGNMISKAACELKMAQRQLWIEHVLWTRSFIVSDFADLADKADVLDRLLKTQDDTGHSFKPFYGEVAGNQIAKLLREHIVLAGKVTDAVKSGNKADLQKYNKLWYQNADKIADTLSSLNPYYSNQVLKDMLHRHLQYVTDQVVARSKQDWKADITAFDLGEEHMIKFADILIDGIIKQFPDMFK